MTGRRLAHYEIIEKLGEGGMGVVWRARDTHLDRDVAIKTLPAERMADPERKRRFVQEAKAASALNHPNIVTIHDISSADGVDFIVMEYIAGKTLDQLIGHRGLRLGETLKYGIQVVDALATAHRAGIIHRDLKPANVMVTAAGLVKVMDFGLAKLTERMPLGESAATETLAADARPRTAEGAILGTVAYMSPEQSEGREVDGRSDVFAFGSLLYEMFTGRRAFHGDSNLSTLSAILRDDPKPVGQLVPGAPRDLEKIIARSLRKDPSRRFQHMDDLRVSLEELKEESESGNLAAAEPLPRQRRSPWIPVAAGVVVLLAGAAGLAVWLSRPGRPAPASNLVRLTGDAGLTTHPTISADGKLLAYASDRGGEGNLDIWVQHVAGGDPVRLTRHPADDHWPHFSPDGSRLVFRSERDGGGVWTVPALGGEERLFAREGRHPQFSSDGAWVAYWVGQEQPTSTRMYIAPAAGGPARQLHREMYCARQPVWAPDGKRIVFQGGRTPAELDWFVTSIEGEVVPTGARALLEKHGLTPLAPGTTLLRAAAWSGGHLLFPARKGDTATVWRVPISDSGRVTGVPEQMVSGTGEMDHPSVPADGAAMVFTSRNYTSNVWSARLRKDFAAVEGRPERLTDDPVAKGYPSLSTDARRLVFQILRSGNLDIFLKELDTGRQRALIAASTQDQAPKISPDGTRVAYQAWGLGEVFVVPLAGGVPEKVGSQAGRVEGWSPDGAHLLVLVSDGVNLLEIATGRQSPFLRRADGRLYNPRFSPDGRWVVFHGHSSATARQVFAAGFRGAEQIHEKDWIAVTDGTALDREVAWSPDGRLVYFLSERDGFRCVWARRVDAETRRPAGAPFPLFHIHNAARSLSNVTDTGAIGFQVVGDRLVFLMGEVTANLWMRKPGV